MQKHMSYARVQPSTVRIIAVDYLQARGNQNVLYIGISRLVYIYSRGGLQFYIRR